MKLSLPSIVSMVAAAALGVVACDHSEPPAAASATATTAVCPATDPSAVTTGPTFHEGDVTGAETWAPEASPHVVTGDLNVRDGGKLTIGPCAVVQIAAGASLNVAYPLVPNRGDLVVEGTAERPIRIEGASDARWNRIHVHAPGTARFAYVTLRGGGGGGVDAHGAETVGVTGDGELPRKPLVFVDHVTVEGSGGAGLRLEEGASFEAGSRDLVITGAGAGDPAHPYPIELGEQAVDSLPTGRYVGNARDRIKIDPETVSGGGGFQEDTTMHDRGVPYHVGETSQLDDLRVGNGRRDAVLTIEAGVKILFEKGTVLGVEADEDGASAIRALGTSEAPIVLSSASSAPSAGDWRGLYFNGPISAMNALQHVRLEYTGADCHCSLVSCSEGVSEYEGAIVFSEPPPSMFLRDSVIAHGAGHGVVQGYAGPAYDWASSNAFEDVAGCAVTLPANSDTSCSEPRPACR